MVKNCLRQYCVHSPQHQRTSLEWALAFCGLVGNLFADSNVVSELNTFNFFGALGFVFFGVIAHYDIEH
jgi:hypothetical protein